MRHALALLFLAACQVESADPIHPARPPAAGPSSGTAPWDGIGAALAVDARQPRPGPLGHRLARPDSALPALVEPGGALVLPELRLLPLGWGRAGALRPLTGPSRIGACVEPVEVGAAGDCLRGVEGRGEGARTTWSAEPRGLHQVFVLDEPLLGDGPLRLELAVEGASTAVDADGGGATLEAGSSRLRYDGLLVWDAAGTTLPAWMEEAPHGLSLVVEDEGARWPLTVDPYLSAVAWSFEPNRLGAGVGNAVALGDWDGDGYADLAAGAANYGNGEPNEGRVYVWSGGPAGPGSAASWIAESNFPGAAFGTALAVGDWNGDGVDDLAASAPQLSDPEGQEGAVWLWYGSSGGLPTSPDWTWESDLADEAMGRALATVEDADGDGDDELAIGFSAWSVVASNAGRAVVFYGDPGGLGSAPGWEGLGSQAGGSYGDRLCSGGDIQNDGYADLVVLTPYWTNGETNEGRVEIYVGGPSGLGTAATWTWETDAASARPDQCSTGDVTGDGRSELAIGGPTAPGEVSNAGRIWLALSSASGLGTPAPVLQGTASGQRIGHALSLRHDLNTDGYADLVHGTPTWTRAYSGEGMVAVHLGGPGGVAAEPVLRLEGGRLNAQMGAAISGGGDVHGDLLGDLAVGSPNWSNGNFSEGRVQLFSGLGSGWVGPGSAAVAGEQAGEGFGAALGPAGDVDGDGYIDVLVGAPYWTGAFSIEGRALLYAGGPLGMASTASWSVAGGQVGALLGSPVAAAGDVNGDGFSDVLLGVAGWDNAEWDQGQARLYLGSASGLSTEADWIVEGAQPYGAYGSSVAGVGDVNNDGLADFAVGAPMEDGAGLDMGHAYLYLGASPGPAPTPYRTWEGGINGLLGSSVGGAGDIDGDGFADVVVSHPYWDNGIGDQGAAHIYSGSPSGPGTAPTWTVESGQAQAHLGLAKGVGDVDGDGFSDLLIGATHWDAAAPDEGLVRLHLGGTAGPALAGSWSMTGNVAGSNLGTALAPAGDIDGDGYADFLVGASGWSGPAGTGGRVWLFLGGASGPDLSGWSAAGGALDASLGADVGAADTDGNGHPEVLASWPFGTLDIPNQGFVRRLDTGAARPDSTPTLTIDGMADEEALGSQISFAGDVDGDGYDDVAIGSPSWSGAATEQGRVELFLGSASGLGSTAAWSASGAAGFDQLGTVGPGGDVDGDGLCDLLVGALGADSTTPGSGVVHLYLGTTGGLTTDPHWSWGSDGPHETGAAVAIAGDLDGDGFADLAVGAPAASDIGPSSGRILVFYGAAPGPAFQPDLVLQGSEGDARLGQRLAPAGDVDADGYDDLLATWTRGLNLSAEGVVGLWTGGPAGLPSAPAWEHAAGEANTAITGLAGRSDVDGDGHADLAIGMAGYSATDQGRVELYLSGSSGPAAAPAWTLTRPEIVGYVGQGLAFGGDVDGDGFGDLLVGSPGRKSTLNGEGLVGLYLGSATGLSTVPEWEAAGGALGAGLGGVVAGGGDWDGDGRGDWMAGAMDWDGAGVDRGQVRGYPGGDRDVRPLHLGLRRPSTDTPVPPGAWSEDPGAFDVVAASRIHLGRAPVHLEAEVEAAFGDWDGLALDAAPTADSAATPELRLPVAGLDWTTPRSVRARLAFDGDSPQQRTGPWFPLGHRGDPHGRHVTPASRNLPPTLGIDTETVLEGQEVLVDVLANDDDPEQILDMAMVSLGGSPGHGVAEVEAGGIRYSHDGGPSVADSFPYTVCDGGDPLRCVDGLVEITVSPVNDAPVAAPGLAATVEGGQIDIDLSTLVTDEEGLGPAATWSVTVPPAHGGLSGSAPAITYLHGGAEEPVDSFQFQVCDSGLPALCAMADVLIDITLVDLPPVLVADAQTLPEGGSVQVDVLANDSDDEGPLDELTLQVTGPPSGGLATVGLGLIDYVHGGGEDGIDTVGYTVCDRDVPAHCEDQVLVLTITPVPDPPVALDDAVALDEGGTVLIPAFDNDADPDTATSAWTVTFPQPPTHGVATLAPGGILYEHGGNETPTDTLSYRVCDPEGLCDEAWINLSITPIDEPPTVTPGGPYAVDEGGSLVLTVLAAMDPEGTPVTFDWDCDGDGTWDGSGPSFALCAFPDDPGGDVLLRALDQGGLSTVVAVPVAVANVAPAITSLAPTTALVLQPWSYLPTAVEPGADTLLWSLAEGPAGLTVDPGTGALSWTPSPADVGPHDVSLVVTDGDGGADIQSWVLFVGANDNDGDGDPDELDCDDNDPLVWSGAPETCNGIDDDCDTQVDPGFPDSDGDGTADCVDLDDDDDGAPDTVDCAPLDPDITPGQPEVCDLLDGDCDPTTLDWLDNDGDGFSPCEGDCDDTDAARGPLAVEACNGLDDDCDPATEDDADDDGDGFSPCEGDCDSADPAVHPDATELCDGQDQDCDGALPAVEADLDQDGALGCADDCDDEDPGVAPGRPELCDGVDQDCDGALGPPAEDDPDGDGTPACGGDCAPFDPWVGPGQVERCDGLDTDCQGGLAPGEADADGDGFTSCAGDCDDDDAATWPGAPEAVDAGTDHNCDGFLGDTDADGDGWSLGGGDCYDALATVHPGAPEVCDGFDSDCQDGALPEERTDPDGDGAVDCLDCGPTDPLVSPGAVERCNGLDDDCDGVEMSPGEIDRDLDGQAPCQGDCDDGSAAARVGLPELCGDGLDNDCEGTVDLDTDHDHDGHSSCSGDCRDLDERVHPGAPELCNQLDDNCDLVVDEGWDEDDDGQRPCNGDCDDGDPTVFLGAPVICDDGTDNDCLPSTQEEVDSDGDGAAACDEPGDCWEGNPWVGPAEPEVCNLIDDDCDGEVDEGLDADGDGVLACAFDCDDEDTGRSPLLPELCGTGVDEDCDGLVDDGCVDPPGPTPEPPPAGCVCGHGDAAPGGFAGVGSLLLLAVRRRRPGGGHAAGAILRAFGPVLTSAVLVAGCPTTPPVLDDDSPSDDDDTTAGDDDVTPDDDSIPDGDDSAPGDDDDTTPLTAWRSALYPVDWTPAFTGPDGAFLHDFSYAGYHRGEAPIPEAASLPGATFSVLDDGADPLGVEDATAVIQATIDAASVAGGVVLVPVGTYRVDGLLTVTSSGVVLRGEGAGSRLAFSRAEGMSDQNHLSFRGTPTQGPDLPLAADAVPRSLTVTLPDASSLLPGDDVVLGHTITDDFISDHGMTGTWVSFNGQWKVMLRRTVIAVDTAPDPDVVTLDAPVRGPLLVRDGASLRVETGALSEVGLLDLAVSNANTHALAWASDRNHAVALVGVKDAFVRGLTSWEGPFTEDPGRHLMSGGILIQDSKRVTVADSVLGHPQHRGGGGNGYLYEVMRSNEILVRDCEGDAGRHNFIQNWDFGTSGCVWLRVWSHDGRALPWDSEAIWTPGLSEYHHSLATANLVDDSEANDGWQGVNRQGESSGAGHSATECVFWNLRGGGTLRSLQWGLGYVVAPNDMDVHIDPAEPAWGQPGEGTEPTDWVEGLGETLPVEPASLYEDQLARRLAGR